MSDNRGTGRTERQMRDAPEKAMFIWCNGNLAWPRRLAGRIGREDLEIVGPAVLDNDAARLRGRELSGIVVDHAFTAPDKWWDIYRTMLSAVVR